MEIKPLEPFRRLFGGGDALLVAPPFAGFERPSLGLHVLQAVARKAGYKVDVFNANVHFAACFGQDAYTKLCYADTGVLSGEKFFAPVAFPGDAQRFYGADDTAFAAEWIRSTAEFIVSLGYPVVGCNTMFEQLNCSIALLDTIKTMAPGIKTILGGAQCEGEMGEGIITLGKGIDLVFQGESERTFLTLLEGGIADTGVARTVAGSPLNDMESLPAIDYSSFFEQFDLLFADTHLRDNNLVWLPLEGSRGCWWGQKHHCTFCGINGLGMGYRNKSPEKLLGEIERCVEDYGVRNILMVDNIMPHEYFSTLLPTLAERNLGLKIFYEQKANLTAKRMGALAAAGANLIQPGIESLSDDILQLMVKGVKSWQNINALRHARMYDVYVNWNLLHSFPGDKLSYYDDIERLIPLLHHLCPPIGLSKLSIDRFSPYFDRPQEYGVHDIQPMAAYHDIFPRSAPLHKLAYHFVADYESEMLHDSAALGRLDDLVNGWIAAWEESTAPPVLSVSQISEDLYLVTDTRAVAVAKFRFVDREHVIAMLFGSHSDVSQASLDYCVAHKYCALIGDVVAPLAYARPRLFLMLCGDTINERPQAALGWKSEVEAAL